MDSFGEQLIAKKVTPADWAKRIAIVVGGVGIAAICLYMGFMTGFMLLLMIAVGALFLMVWLLSGSSVEYEYIVTNTDLDIDKISGKRKRKRLITLKINQATDFGVYDGSQGKDVQATVIATDASGVNAHYLICKHKTHGMTMLVFTPDDKMVELITNSLPHTLRTSLKLEERKRAAKADTEE